MKEKSSVVTITKNVLATFYPLSRHDNRGPFLQASLVWPRHQMQCSKTILQEPTSKSTEEELDGELQNMTDLPLLDGV